MGDDLYFKLNDGADVCLYDFILGVVQANEL